MGKLVLITAISSEIWVNILRIPSIGLRASKKVNYIGSFGQMQL